MYSGRVEQIPEHIRKHINIIAEQEKQFHSRQTVMQRVSHAIGAFVGSIPFIVLHVIWFSVWLLVNTSKNWFVPFDPFPFALLAIIIEIEGIFLASFILMRQNRMSQRSDQREHLILQVLLLAEQEITTLLDVERRKSMHHGPADIALDPNVATLSQPTSLDDLTRGLEENIPLD